MAREMSELREKQATLRAVTEKNASSFHPGSGGGNSGGMDPRIAVLEHRAEAADQRMARMEDKLDRLIEATSKLPSTNAMWTMVASVIGICAASVGVIVAILTWLQGFHH